MQGTETQLRVEVHVRTSADFLTWAGGVSAYQLVKVVGEREGLSCRSIFRLGSRSSIGQEKMVMVGSSVWHKRRTYVSNTFVNRRRGGRRQQTYLATIDAS